VTGQHILVAEDEGLIAMDVAFMLEKLGFHVIGPVAQVDEVLQAAKQLAQVDCALLDVNLRGRKVFAALPALIDRGIPVYLASGYDDDAFFPEPFRHLPRITKPFNEEMLRNILLGARTKVRSA
jgi:CheY-like chemotaxis protein